MNTSTTLLAAATDVLKRGGYTEVEHSPELGLVGSEFRLFEDVYGIVLVAVFDTWTALQQRWPDVQAALADVISQHVRRDEPKAWDGYLVLLTNGIAPDAAAVSAVRYDVSRVRKLVGAGDEMRSPSDVATLLLPLLPLEVQSAFDHQQSVLNHLPNLLESKGIDGRSVEIVVKAFHDNEPLVEALHEKRRSS